MRYKRCPDRPTLNDASVRKGFVMDFWEFIFTVLILGPLLLLWGFAVFDIFRRGDLGGWAKALWLVVVLAFPWIGTLVYVVINPNPWRGARDNPADQRAASPNDPVQQTASALVPAATDTVGQLATLGELRANGTLTEEEFQQQKARILAASSAATATAAALPTVSVPTVVLPPMDAAETAGPANSPSPS
jgi:Short C-terminal domain/Phospholipase_D-nuclease N-terminal